MFYQNHSLTLRSYSGDILKFSFKKSLESLDLDLRNPDCLTGLDLTLWFCPEKYLKFALLESDSFYNKLELELKRI